ncbi:MAG: hypothetical protein QOG23_1538 [Blastocatellia bacterium]|jgi:hypothetical protein|nr:hypothetical protein [Blastocatellia bacterium]
MSADEHIALLWSARVLRKARTINIWPLCGQARFFVGTVET